MLIRHVRCPECTDYYCNTWFLEDVEAIEKEGKCVRCLLLFVAPKQDKNGEKGTK